MSQPLPAPGAGPIAGDDRPLNAREYQLLQRLLSDPFSLPMSFKTWLVGYLETSDLSLPMSSIMGLPTVVEGVQGGDSAWLIPTFSDSWSNYGGGFVPARYRKLSTGLVLVEGLVKRPTTPGANSVAFTLPAGYRPNAQLMFAVQSTGGTTRWDVATDGRVMYVGDGPGSASTYSSLSIQFYADQ